MVTSPLLNKYVKTIDYFLIYSNYLALFIAYVIIVVGIFEGIIFIIKSALNTDTDINILDRRTHNIIETRIKVLNSINLGFVFIIAGDIIKTIYIPDMLNLIKILAVIGIREVLSIFTNKEIEYLKKLQTDTLLEKTHQKNDV